MQKTHTGATNYLGGWLLCLFLYPNQIFVSSASLSAKHFSIALTHNNTGGLCSYSKEYLAKVQIPKSLMLCHLGFLFFYEFHDRREIQELEESHLHDNERFL